MAFWLTCGSLPASCSELPGSCSRPCAGLVLKGQRIPEEYEPDELDNPEIFNGSLPAPTFSPTEGPLDNFIGLPPYILAERTTERSRQRQQELRQECLNYRSNSSEGLPLCTAMDMFEKDLRADAHLSTASIATVLKSNMEALAEAERAVVDPRTGMESCQLLDLESPQRERELEFDAFAKSSLSSRAELPSESAVPISRSTSALQPASLVQKLSAAEQPQCLPSSTSAGVPDGIASMESRLGTAGYHPAASSAAPKAPAAATVLEEEHMQRSSPELCVCGNALVPDDLFCEKCGRRRGQAEQRSPQQLPLELPTREESSASNSISRPNLQLQPGEFQLGQQVEFQADFSDEWQKGVVTSTAPLHVRPGGCNLSNAYPRVRALEESPKNATDEAEPRRSTSDRLSFLRDRLPLWPTADASAPEDCGFFFFSTGPFLKLRAPNGEQWGEYCATAEPSFSSLNAKIMTGAWAECMHAAVVFENSHPRWKEDPDYSLVAPTKQVTDYFEACGHDEHLKALEEYNQDTRRRLASSGASGISSSRCSSRATSPGPMSSLPSRDVATYSLSRASA